MSNLHILTRGRASSHQCWIGCQLYSAAPGVVGEALAAGRSGSCSGRCREGLPKHVAVSSSELVCQVNIVCGYLPDDIIDVSACHDGICCRVCSQTHSHCNCMRSHNVICMTYVDACDLSQFNIPHDVLAYAGYQYNQKAPQIA